MKHPHIATGKHTTGRDPRFRINTAPGIMEPTHGVNEAHGSVLDRKVATELRDELNAWLEANPSVEEQIFQIVGDRLDPEAVSLLMDLVGKLEGSNR